jgi:hypothetical protein
MLRRPIAIRKDASVSNKEVGSFLVQVTSFLQKKMRGGMYELMNGYISLVKDSKNLSSPTN